MHEQGFFIVGRLPGLNELLEARSSKRRFGAKGNVYASMKKQYGDSIYWQAYKAALCHMAQVRITFTWIETDRMRDPDNIAAGGRKIILDALVKAGVLDDDGWKQIHGWQDIFKIDKANPGVDVLLQEIGDCPHVRSETIAEQAVAP